MTDQQPELPASAALELLELKVLLGEALVSARSEASVSRQIAVILLDGANERAIYMSAGNTNVALGERPTFVASCDKVYEALKGSGWRRPAWTDVRKLHLARNQTQHSGLSADRELLPIWAGATEEFVRSLIEAAYIVSLDDVWLADAIRDTESREQFRQAEHYLSVGLPLEAVEMVVSAFNRSRQEWSAMRRDMIAQPWVPARESLLDVGWGDYIKKKLAVIDDYADVSPFAHDVSEYIWLQALITDRTAPVTVSEATRALRFVFWWIVRYQAFARTLAPNRRSEWLKSQRRVRADSTHIPKVEQIRVARHISDNEYELEFKLRDVPEDARFASWQGHLVTRLHPEVGYRIGKWWRLSEDGTLYGTVELEIDPATMLERVSSALRDADQDVTRELEANAAKLREFEERRSKYERDVARTLSPWPSDIASVTYDIAQFGPDDTSMTKVMLGSDSSMLVMEARDVLIQDDRISQCFATSDGAIAIQPVVDPSELPSLLAPVVALIAARRGAIEKFHEAQRSVLADFTRRLHTAMNDARLIAS